MKTLLLTVLLAGTVLSQSSASDLKASMAVLGVSDLSRSMEFLGLPSAPAPGDFPMFRAGNLVIVLNPALSGSNGAFELVFTVDSVDSVRSQLTARGCRFINDSKEVAKGMWVATFTDPEDIVLHYSALVSEAAGARLNEFFTSINRLNSGFSSGVA